MADRVPAGGDDVEGREAFDYDVFLSFASADQEAAQRIQETLERGGLRVFWAPEGLQKELGLSFFEAIQHSLVKSRHFVLYWTAQAKGSGWVKAEYEAFFNQCYVKGKGAHRLIILPDGREPISSLPSLLQSLQVARSAEDVVGRLAPRVEVPMKEEARPTPPLPSLLQNLQVARFAADVEAQTRTLSVRPFLNSLTQAWTNHEAIDLLHAGLAKRTFAVLRITNEGTKNLRGMVAQCLVVEPESEVLCVWSQESGDQFVLGGNHTTSLNVGDYRLLVVAQALGESKVWAPLPSRDRFHQVPSEEWLEHLKLGSTVEMTIRFRAEGLDQIERFKLSFELTGDPKIEDL